jgi:UDP-N-acetylmuramate dehydrogenase
VSISLLNPEHAMRGKLLKDAPLANYTSWRVGGPAQTLYEPADLNDLKFFLQNLPTTEPLTWLGLGSNILVRESGIKGTVIITQGALTKIELLDETTVRAEAGVACPALARFCARQGLEGLEYLAGIPGTVGGALAMNAGCHGGETWNQVLSVETLDRLGHAHQRMPHEYAVSYRSVKGTHPEWFVAGYFQLSKGNKEQSLEKIRKLLAHRAATQPTSEPNCGSVFRNPPGDYAARLIEACGLKGTRIGQACVSTKHANFIINEGSATAKDIEALIQLIGDTVKQKYNIQLQREVHILGE